MEEEHDAPVSDPGEQEYQALSLWQKGRDAEFEEWEWSGMVCYCFRIERFQS